MNQAFVKAQIIYQGLNAKNTEYEAEDKVRQASSKENGRNEVHCMYVYVVCFMCTARRFDKS